jgi:hypothetical protein
VNSRKIRAALPRLAATPKKLDKPGGAVGITLAERERKFRELMDQLGSLSQAGEWFASRDENALRNLVGLPYRKLE